MGHLRDKYLALKKENKIDSTTSNNTKALIAKQFKGYCRECGEYGHKRANCPKLKRNDKFQKIDKKNTKKKFTKNVTCFYCGKKGHVERDCFKRKRDAEQGIVKPVTKRNERDEDSKTETDTAYELITSGEIVDTKGNEWEMDDPIVPNQDQPKMKYSEVKTLDKKKNTR